MYIPKNIRPFGMSCWLEPLSHQLLTGESEPCCTYHRYCSDSSPTYYSSSRITLYKIIKASQDNFTATKASFSGIQGSLNYNKNVMAECYTLMYKDLYQGIKL